MHVLEKTETLFAQGNYVRNKVLCTLLTIGIKAFQSSPDIDAFLNSYDGVSNAILSIANTNGGTISFHSTDIIHISFFADDRSIFHTNRALEAALQIEKYLASCGLKSCLAVDVGYCVHMAAGPDRFYESVMYNTAAVDTSSGHSGILVTDAVLGKLEGIVTQLGASLTAKGRDYHTLLLTSPTEAEHSFHFIGRELEILRLRLLQEETTKSFAKTCVITGEAGVGKSTLLDKFLEPSKIYKVRVGFSPDGGSLLQFLSDVISYIMTNDGIRDHNTQALEYIAAKFLIRDQLFRDALNFIYSQPTLSKEWDALESSVRVYMAVEVVINILETLATNHQVVSAIEDAHWAPQTVFQHVTDIMSRLQRSRIMFVFTSRNNDVSSEIECKNTFNLIPFNKHETQLLYHTLVPHEKDTSEARAAIDKCNGNPFYINETIKCINSGHFQSENVPDTVQGIILTRVNALPLAEQHLLRFASLLGYEFLLKELCQIFSLEIHSLQYVAKSLVKKGYLYRSGLGHTYLFTHELTRMAISAAILHSDKVSAHQAALRYYQEHAPSKLCSIAFHAYEAGDYDAAYRANLALYDAAIDNYDSVLALTAIARCELIATPDTTKLSDLRIKRLRAQLLKGDTSLLQKTLRELTQPIDATAPDQNVPEVEGAAWLYKWLAADYHSAIQDILKAKQTIPLGTELSITASIRLAGIYSDIGEYHKSTAVLDALREEIIDNTNLTPKSYLAFPYRPVLDSLSARNAAYSGDFEKARQRADEAIKACQYLTNATSRCIPLCHVADAYIACGMNTEAARVINEVIESVDGKNIDILIGYFDSIYGYIGALNGKKDAIYKIKSSIESCISRGQVSRVSLYYYYLTKSLLVSNRKNEAKDSISQAISLSTRYKERGVLLLSLKLADAYKLLPERMDVSTEIAELEAAYACECH